MPRLVTAHLFHSVNGVVESPDQWQFGAFGPEEGAMMGQVLAPITEVIIGRGLWQEWSEFWPSAEATDPFGAWINPIPKHVISSTLEGELGWNSTLIDGDPIEYVRALKAGEGGEISVAGGIETVRSLFLGGVIDRLILTTHPVVGQGRRLFDETIPVTRLELLSAQPTSVGNVMATYALRAED